LARGSRSAFTLIELLVSLFLVAVLMSLLLPALRAVRSQSRAVKCQVHLRNIAFNLSGDRFWLETFQESQYRIDEYWYRSESRATVSTDELDIMTCPEVRGTVELISNTPCRFGAILPKRHVSYGMNLRLFRAEVMRGGRWGTAPVHLSSAILQPSLIPLVWDIDGGVAADRRITPHYAAPPGAPEAPYASGDWWFPEFARHDGVLQVGFVGGEVLVTRTPLAERSWKWTFNPR